MVIKPVHYSVLQFLFLLQHQTMKAHGGNEGTFPHLHHTTPRETAISLYLTEGCVGSRSIWTWLPQYEFHPRLSSQYPATPDNEICRFTLWTRGALVTLSTRRKREEFKVTD